MDVAVIGTGFIGTTLGQAFARAGHQVTFGSRHPADDAVSIPNSQVDSIPAAMERAEVVVLALPSAAVGELAQNVGGDMSGKLVIDATNRMQGPVANSRALLPDDVRYARAFNTVGGENMAEPRFAEATADMFFSSPEDDRPMVESLIEAVGMRPVFVGEDSEELIDALFHLWVTLAMKQGRGRRLAFRLLDH